METLPADALNAVLAKLDHIDLLAASSACRQMRAAATADSALWRALCTRRWHGTLNTALWPLRPSAPPQQPQQQPQQQQPRADYRAVFASDNGWSAPRLATQRYAGSSWSDELVALHPSTAPDGTTTIVVSSCKELRILEAGPSPEDQVQIRRAANVALRSGRELWSSVAALPATVAGAEGLVAAGGCHGRLALFRLPEAHGSAPSADVMEPASSLVFPGNSCIISQLHYLPSQQRVAVLHDSLAALRATPQHSRLSVVDVASWREVAPGMADVLAGYELAAVAPAGPSGSELLASSVRLSDDQAAGWPCQRCYSVTPAALCFHKAAASSAALCVFDLRASQPMVARYSTHHRSLHPHLELTRGHFCLTSHAGVPLAVWDRRQMNGPVYEAPPLPRELDPRLAASGWLPLEHPELHEQPTSQGLHLSATSDLLLGRADNGMCWLWDLSECMGWADGSHAGSWLRNRQQVQRPASSHGGVASAQQAGGAAGEAAPGGADVEMSEGPAGGDHEGHMNEHNFDRGPLPLGCIGAPYEAWCTSEDGEAAPLHWLPCAAAWMAHNRVVALGGLEVEDKQRLFPAHAQGNPYPSNALVVASLSGGE